MYKNASHIGHCATLCSDIETNPVHSIDPTLTIIRHQMFKVMLSTLVKMLENNVTTQSSTVTYVARVLQPHIQR